MLGLTWPRKLFGPTDAPAFRRAHRAHGEVCASKYGRNNGSNTFTQRTAKNAGLTVVFAAHTIPFIWQESPAKTIEALAQRGFHQIEFFGAPGYIDVWAPPAETMKVLGPALKATQCETIGVDISTHDYNLASLDSQVAALTLKAYERLMDLASELGIRNITVHGGRRIAFNAPPGTKQWDALRSSFDRLAIAAERRSFDVLIENVAPSVINGAAAMERFVNDGAWPNLYFVYDIANAAAAGEDPVAGLAKVLPRVKAVHISDTEHGAIGSGSIDFGAIHNVLTEANYKGHLVLEICTPNALDDLSAGAAALAAGGWS